MTGPFSVRVMRRETGRIRAARVPVIGIMPQTAVTLLRVVGEVSGENEVPHSPLDREAAERLARTLRIVADPTRLQVLSLLNDAPDGEVAVRDLVEPLGLRQPTISHHLRIMFEERLLTRQQRGREVYYAIAASRRDEIADLLR